MTDQAHNANIGSAQGVIIGDGNVTYINYYAERHPEVDAQHLQLQMRDYLRALEERFRNLEIRGIESQNQQVVQLALESIYVPLQVRYQDPQRAEPAAAGDAKGQAEAAESIILNQAFALGPRLVMTGGVGSGKSTLLMYMAWVLAADLLGRRLGLAGERLGLGAVRPLPVYIPIEKYIAYRRQAAGDKKALAVFIAWQLQAEGWDFPPGFIDYLLRQEDGVVLLLDGLDEISSADDRRMARAAVEQFVDGREHLRVVVTSRPQAYSGAAVLGRGFIHLDIPPLEAEQVNDLIRRMYAALLKQPQDKTADLIASIERLEDQRRAHGSGTDQRLINSPLMARLAFLVHYKNNSLATQRAALYEEVVKVILAPNFGPDEENQVALKNRLGDLALNLDMHQYLAYQMHRRGEKTGRNIDRATLSAILSEQPEFVPYIEPLLEQICTRSTLIEPYGEDTFRFFHHSFQEYLAARYIALYCRPQEVLQLIVERPQELSWWREVVLLAIGASDELRRRATIPLIKTLAGLELAVKLPLDQALACAELAAMGYSERRWQNPADDEALRVRLHSLVMHPQRLQATPRLRAAAADARDRLGHEPEGLYQFVPVPNGAKPKFWMARYPVTNRQYQRFLDRADFADSTLWQGFPMFDEKGKHLDDSGWDETAQKWLKERASFEAASDGRRVISPRYWDDPRFGLSRPNAPVVGVTWFEANAYCRWLQRTWAEREEAAANPGLKPHGLRLPIEPEWLLAAGGGEPKERYAWDVPGRATADEAEIIRRCNVRESGIGRTTPVDLYPDGQSPSGVWDLSGNVWEWQANYYAADNREVLGLRGGSWNNYAWYARPAERIRYNPADHWYLSVGFRPLLARP